MIKSKMCWSAALLALLMIINVLVSNADTECGLCKNAENWSSEANGFLTGNTAEQTQPTTIDSHMAANPKLSRENIWGLKDNSILTDNSVEKTSSSRARPSSQSKRPQHE